MREIHQTVTMKERLQPRWPPHQITEMAPIPNQSPALVPAHEPAPEPAPPWLPVHLWPPNKLLMGRQDVSLPQVMSSEVETGWEFNFR